MWLNKKITTLTAVGAAVLALAPATFALDQPLANSDGTITFSGQTLMRVRTAAGGYTAAQRANAIQQRLIPILSLKNLGPSDITVQQERPYQDADIYVRDRLLVTVDRGLAQANGNNDPGDLARAWANNLRGILPEVSVKNNPNVEAEGRAMNAAAGNPAPSAPASQP